MTPGQCDQNWTDIENSSNALNSMFSTALNPDGTLKNGSVSTAALTDRVVTQAKLAFLSGFYAVDSGVANAMVITFSPALGAYAAGLIFKVKAAATNTTPTTLKGDPGLAAVAVKKYTATGLSDLVVGDIIAGGVYSIVHDGTSFILLNPTFPARLSSIFLVTPQTIHAWAAVATWVTYDLSGLGVPASKNPVNALIQLSGKAIEGGPAPNACQFQASLRSDSLGDVYPALIMEGGNIGGTPVSTDVIGQFWVPVKISGGAVNVDMQLLQTVVGNTDSVSMTATIVGYST